MFTGSGTDCRCPQRTDQKVTSLCFLYYSSEPESEISSEVRFSAMNFFKTNYNTTNLLHLLKIM